jgi:CelD/BcsL family acetyltransferase involved in cellulose biosynthesis
MRPRTTASPFAMPALSHEVVSDATSFSALASEWDALVRNMPRPSPFLVHAWLEAWWRHYGEGATLQVHVIRSDGRLAGALPLFVRPWLGLRIARFLGGHESTLADALIADGAPAPIAVALVEGALGAGNDLVDVFGLPADSRLAGAAGPRRLRVIPRVESPVLVLPRGWHTAYTERTSAKKRNLHRRRRRQLAELGRLETQVAREGPALDEALEEAFRLHALRFSDRPDSSSFGTAAGMRFHRDALAAVAPLGLPRITTLRLDSRAIAFHYWFSFCGRMYVHRLAFDPSYARFSPGLVNTLDAIEGAAAEGIERIEFLGSVERYKLELADHLEPLHQGVGLASGVRGHTAAALRTAGIRSYLRLKRSERARRVYVEGLAPARRVRRRLAR